MIPLHDLMLFAIAAVVLAITPGPNMLYLITRTLSQGKRAGFISLMGVICGFLFHIIPHSALEKDVYLLSVIPNA